MVYTFRCKKSDEVLEVKADTFIEACVKANEHFRPIWADKNVDFYSWSIRTGTSTDVSAMYGYWD